MINPLGFIITISSYLFANKLRENIVLKKIPTILLASCIVCAVLNLFNIEFEIYNESAVLLTYLLLPATISLGYPIFKNIKLLKKNKRIIFSAFMIATLSALALTFILAKICNTEIVIIESLLPKSTTAPIAIEISKNIGGIPELTACVVLLTGAFGGVFGHKILKWAKVKNDIAIGLSIGAASHVIGTASCIEKGKEKQIVMSSIAFVIVGVLTAILAPILIYIFTK